MKTLYRNEQKALLIIAETGFFSVFFRLTTEGRCQGKVVRALTTGDKGAGFKAQFLLGIFLKLALHALRLRKVKAVRERSRSHLSYIVAVQVGSLAPFPNAAVMGYGSTLSLVTENY